MSEDAPVKLCECGCGKPAPIAKSTKRKKGIVAGQPLRFIHGHYSRVNPVLRAAQDRANQRRRGAVEPRRAEVASLYRQGKSLDEIARTVGATRDCIASDIRRLRKDGVDLPYRHRPVRLPEDTAGMVSKAWSDEHLSVPAIAERFDWSINRATAVISNLRRAGFRIDPRKGLLIALPESEKREVVRRYRKRKRQPAPTSLDKRRQMVLRVLKAAGRPLAFREIDAFLRSAGETFKRTDLQYLLRRMRQEELAASCEAPPGRWFDRQHLWFVPLGAEQPAENLTLADAERETELAALIESQQDELKRGDWIDSEKGHWADKSIDAPLTADGFTILDTLGDEDEALAELVGEAA